MKSSRAEIKKKIISRIKAGESKRAIYYEYLDSEHVDTVTRILAQLPSNEVKNANRTLHYLALIVLAAVALLSTLYTEEWGNLASAGVWLYLLWNWNVIAYFMLFCVSVFSFILCLFIGGMLLYAGGTYGPEALHYLLPATLLGSLCYSLLLWFLIRRVAPRTNILGRPYRDENKLPVFDDTPLR
jgi:hypothetical protein